MLSKGQIIFASFFVIAFIVTMIFSYRKDGKIHKTHYKGSFWILAMFILFIGILFIIKSLFKE